MPESKHARTGGRRLGWVVGLLLAALVGAVLYWSLSALVADEDSTGEVVPDPETSSSQSSSPSGSPSSPSATDERRVIAGLRQCATDISAAERTLEAARKGVLGWDAHVQARTDALAGRISTREMNRIFDETRLAGPRHVRHYQAARKDFGGTLRCDLPAPDSEAEKQAVAGCTAQAAAVERAVSATELTMDEWRRHLKKMAEFRNGGMSARHAQHLWVLAWRTAPINIAKYERAIADLVGVPQCGPPAG